MTREQLEHVIRAAAAIVDDELVVVGSQAILGEHPDAPASLLVSQEADVFPRTNPGAAIEIDGAIGDGSQFHETYGYYAHGVGPETPTLPRGWEDRLVRVRAPALTAGSTHVVAWCLESHDLVLSKCAAGRDRDWEFVEVALAHRLVRLEVLRKRVADLPLDQTARDRIGDMLDGVAARVEKRA